MTRQDLEKQLTIIIVGCDACDVDESALQLMHPEDLADVQEVMRLVDTYCEEHILENYDHAAQFLANGGNIKYYIDQRRTDLRNSLARLTPQQRGENE